MTKPAAKLELVEEPERSFLQHLMTIPKIAERAPFSVKTLRRIVQRADHFELRVYQPLGPGTRRYLHDEEFDEWLRDRKFDPTAL